MAAREAEQNISIAPARTAAEFAAAKSLIRDYTDWLGVDLDHQGFDAEMAGFPKKYLPPEGEILLARCDGAIAGVVCLHALEPGICEMKRMWAVDTFRGKGIGRLLGVAIIEEARVRGYRLMRLDTLARLTSALRLYEELGFRRIPAYYHNPIEDVIYMEKDLLEDDAA